ncbi:chaperone protein dnaJ 1, mitochondrial-like [Hibiscus syriacus]|uniref:chaperone protein dnaJ 1, mitochondrial-like n=1 Tax=Hibiscus syriacus TaxID=106335 RepID=UPI001920FD0F|nr:chaperone protein dnaJ 1, mitochondrial-like [Hibiscus syriacus]
MEKDLDRNDQTSPYIQTELLLYFSEVAKGCTKDLCFDAFVPCDSCVFSCLVYFLMKMGVAIYQMPKLKFVQFAEAKGLNNVYHAKDPGLLKVLRKLKLQYLQVWILKIQYVYQKLVILSDREINLVTDDPIFARDGADVYVNSNISLTQAILGGEAKVPTLSGKVQVKIPKGCQHGELLVLRGKGLPKYGFLLYHGDQYVRFRVNLPT